jgi:hypothetical protein
MDDQEDVVRQAPLFPSENKYFGDSEKNLEMKYTMMTQFFVYN